MRLKFGIKLVASTSLPTAEGSDGATIPQDTSGDVIAYFPDLKNQDGEMKMINVYSPVPLSPRFGLFPNCLTLWANNMRAINEIPDYTANPNGDSLHINNGYTQKDNVTDDDKIVEVLVDKIGFYGWNSLTNNASVTYENGMGNMLRLPNVTGIPVSYPTNDKNYSRIKCCFLVLIIFFAGFNQPMASYLSFGYDSASAAVKKPQITFLMIFFTALPSTVQPIPYLKAGYFYCHKLCRRWLKCACRMVY